ncbi:DUF4349 domain-containing protein [Alkaliphilus transvaalensis]|uniref:DUF4349 domain-containing protein n=1 Tax=Alkaliphilus transvaalensis TaxID=114628 RepID=UPI00047AE061|nr:DUF4349 domain-containing protein [Alkaliphilus transvaalensis]
MNCSQFEEYASLFIDEMLTEEEMIKFRKHIESCENCYISLENLKLIVSTVNEMEEVDLPTDFTLSLRKKLQDEKEKETEKNKSLINWKVVSGIAAGLMITAISMTALEDLNPNKLMMEPMTDAGYSNEMAARDMENYGTTPTITGRSGETTTQFSVTMGDKAAESVEEQEALEKEEFSVATAELATDNRKIINKGRLSLETMEFDESYKDTYYLVEKYGGYFQTSDTQYRLLNREKPEESLRTTYFNIRVPSENFNDIFQELKEVGIVINENTNAQDITMTYRDVETEVLNLEIQEERLREILQKAEKIEDILRIENELSRIRLQINSMRGTLKNYDQLVSLSTIEVELIEVKETSDSAIKLQSVDQGLLGRGKDNFIKSVNQIIRFGERALINLYGLIPWAVLITAITLPVVSIGNKIIKKRRNNHEK